MGAFRFKTIYKATRVDKRTSCPNGCKRRRLAMLSAQCMTKLPSFWICHECGYIGEIGVGVVSKGKPSRGTERGDCAP